MQNEPYLPENPLERFVEVAEAVGREKSWGQSWSFLRYAALSLTTTPGLPADCARQLFEAAAELKETTRWFSSLRSDLRYCIVAGLLRSGRSVDELRAAIDTTSALFRSAKLRRGEAQEALVARILMEDSQDGIPTREQVEKIAEIYAGMKEAHRVITGTDDYAAAALLATSGNDIGQILERIEALYEGLRDLSFMRGNQLQLASHLLYFAPDPDDVLLERFRALYAGFQERGLWMNHGDYDEVAILAFLDHDSERVVAHVLDDREALRSALSPKPSKQEGFTLATNTTFLHLATHDRQNKRVVDAMHIAQILALLQAQQAAAAAAASTVATSGTAAG